LGERGCTIRFTPADRCLPDSTSERQRHRRVRDHQPQHPLQLAFCSVTPERRKRLEVGKDARYPLHALRRAANLDLVRAQIDRHLKPVLHQPQVFRRASRTGAQCQA